MKQLTFLFLCISISLHAQNAPGVDTTYIKQVGNTFFAVQRTTYDNGNYTEAQNIVGDTAQLYQQFKNVAQQRATTMANDIRITSQYTRQITAIFRESDNTQALIGMNPIDSLRAENIDFWTGTWNVRGDTAQTITISKTNAGLLRYKVNSGTFKAAQVIGRSVIRLNNYPNTGTSTDFYFYEGVKFIQTNGRRWIIKQP